MLGAGVLSQKADKWLSSRPDGNGRRDLHWAADPANFEDSLRPHFTALPVPISKDQDSTVRSVLRHRDHLARLFSTLWAGGDLAGAARCAALMHRVAHTFDATLYRATVQLLRAAGDHNTLVRYFQQVIAISPHLMKACSVGAVTHAQ